MRKTFVADLPGRVGHEVTLAGWVHRLRTLASTTFAILQDASSRSASSA
jgi:aspartyl-tRNA synthetase